MGPEPTQGPLSLGPIQQRPIKRATLYEELDASVLPSRHRRPESKFKPMSRHARNVRLWLSVKSSDPILLWQRPICSGASTGPCLSSDSNQLVGTLISIFTKQPFSQDAPELRNLASTLTTRVVESVLNRLKSWKVALEFFSWASSQSGYRHNCYTINAMAAILSRARRNAEMKTLSLYLVNSQCSISPGALGFFIRCLGDVGMVEEANAVFERVRDSGLCIPNNYAYNCLLEAISHSDKVDILEARLKEMRDSGCALDKFTLTPVLQMYSKLGRIESVMEIFDVMSDRGWLDGHVLSIVVICFSKLGMVDRVFELIERMESQNIRPNERTFHTLIHGLMKDSRLDAALELFDKMKRSGFTSDISIYDVIIEGLCKNGQLKSALSLYLEMRESGIRPDSVLLMKLSGFFSEEQIIQLLEEFPEGMDAKAVTLYYNLLLNLYVKNGLVDKAHRMLCLMIGADSDSNGHNADIAELIKLKGTAFVNTEAFNIIIGALVQKGKLDSALSLFRDMDQVRCRPTIKLYNSLIEGLCNSNRLDEARELLTEMKGSSGPDPTPFTHNCIFGCLCRREDVIGALEMVKEMRMNGHEPWIKHSSDLVKRLCDKGRVSDACSFLEDMVQEGFVPDIVAYSAAINGLIHAHKVDQAVELFRDLQSQGRRPDVVAYNILINGLCKVKRAPEAHDIFKEMLQDRLVPSIITYNSMIDGWCKIGDIDKALLYLSKMSSEAQKKDPNVITYTTLIAGLCNARRPGEALTMWDEMKKRGCEPNNITFMAMINGLSKCGRPEEARLYLKEMLEKGMRPEIYVYVGLLNAFISELKFEEAFEVLKELLENESFSEHRDKAYTAALRDVIVNLGEDERTSSGIRALIADSQIPALLDILDNRVPADILHNRVQNGTGGIP
ncbi:hypothetical protein CRG98_019262 [Punica granatum]|uniref:Pentatricopeptide repeat-containing protein-mitochondrial domain-containing protein n=2 Tax=Punica granatum TaxID=22663 RepID=A0A2I0JXZ0_PUNGR|nr:hypothetical protein CRG98_019262 [Punica granatum]